MSISDEVISRLFEPDIANRFKNVESLTDSPADPDVANLTSDDVIGIIMSCGEVILYVAS
jgi:hypothetical protein